MFENEGRILEENLNQTIREVLRLKKEIKRFKGSKVKLFATHALRNAVNHKDVSEEIEKRTGFKVEIIGPENEGRLYFDAIIQSFVSTQDYVVVDMGGGSVQILIGNKERLLTNQSFKTGAQLLHEKFTKNPHDSKSFTTEKDLGRMENYLRKQYANLKENSKFPLIYGSSNIIDLFKVSKIPLEFHQDSLLHPFKTQASYLRKFINHIIQFPYGGRERMYRFQKGYMWGVDKAFLNILILVEKFSSPYIIPSNISTTEGFLYHLRRE